MNQKRSPSSALGEFFRTFRDEFLPTQAAVARIVKRWKLGHYDGETAMNKIDRTMGDQINVMVPVDPNAPDECDQPPQNADSQSHVTSPAAEEMT